MKPWRHAINQATEKGMHTRSRHIIKQHDSYKQSKTTQLSRQTDYKKVQANRGLSLL